MGQRRIQKEKELALEEMKWIHNVPKPGVGAVLRKTFIIITNVYIFNKGRS